MKQKAIDREEWKQGLYFMSALNTVMANAFSKNSNAKYYERPLIEEQEYQEMLKNPTEEQKERELERFFAEQQAMRINFNRNKKKVGVNNGRTGN